MLCRKRLVAVARAPRSTSTTAMSLCSKLNASCNAVPSKQRASIFAPWLRRSSTVANSPDPIALCSGVRLCIDVASSFAPFAKRVVTVSIRPYSAALCSAVSPQKSAISILVPLSRSAVTDCSGKTGSKPRRCWSCARGRTQ